jgi:hypothetical protein
MPSAPNSPSPASIAAKNSTTLPITVRSGLFADPVRLPGLVGPGDQLVAFLGRRPRLAAAPWPGSD